MEDSFLVKMGRGLRSLSRSFGLELSRYNLHHSEELLLKRIREHLGIHTILDVGANAGQYALQAMQHGFNGAIYSFEPIPGVFNQLEMVAAKYPRWHVHNTAMGASVEEVEIHVSENFVSSSILEVTAASTDAAPASRTTHQEKIKVSTVDVFFSNHAGLKKEILLKLDIQGYELNALKGAVSSLPSIKMIQVELSFTKLYEGGPLYDEVIDHLRRAGYELFTLIPGFRDEHSGRMLQADGIFVRDL